MIPNAKVFGQNIDLSAITVAVKYQFKEIAAVSTAFPSDFSTHDMRSKG
jgi:hypothetical protein